MFGSRFDSNRNIINRTISRWFVRRLLSWLNYSKHFVTNPTSFLVHISLSPQIAWFYHPLCHCYSSVNFGWSGGCWEFVEGAIRHIRGSVELSPSRVYPSGSLVAEGSEGDRVWFPLTGLRSLVRELSRLPLLGIRLHPLWFDSHQFRWDFWGIRARRRGWSSC